MQAPQAPIDIKITLGSQTGVQNLINLDIDITDDKEAVKNYAIEKKLPEDLGTDCALWFDFYVEAGRQKQAIQYFSQNQQSQEGKSPLQILFSTRPSEESELCKMSFEQHEGFIRVFYRFFIDSESEDIQSLSQILQTFQNNNLRFQAHANLDIKGFVAHNKKNRTNVKVDYAKFHLTSNAFCSEHLMNSLFAIEEINSDLQQIINNPFTELVKKSKVAKINLKLDSFRKINKFYIQTCSKEPKQPETKEFKYQNKGIFRQKAQANMIYNGQYLIKINGLYESQDVFIRLVKVYAKFFQKLLDTPLYND